MQQCDKIYVTKSFLPPIEEYNKWIAKIFENGQLTNQGPLLRELESRLSTYLGVKNFHYVTNGTIAIQIALKALGITEGEIITTPFSYVATTSSILWERCKPVFVDIEPENFTIDADKIEAAITPQTKAILAVHVFGYACDVEKIEKIAKKHNIFVIYDAAHAFASKYKGKSLLDYGDISTCSFHATKLFHTIEGGACIVKDETVSEKLELIKRFGHNGDNHLCLGINAKQTEMNAAMGLSNLPYIGQILEKRLVREKHLTVEVVIRKRKLILRFEERIGKNRKDRIFFGVNHTLLQGRIEFRIGDLLRIGADRVKRGQEARSRRHADANTLEVVSRVDHDVLGRRLAEPVVEHREAHGIVFCEALVHPLHYNKEFPVFGTIAKTSILNLHSCFQSLFS